MDGCRHVTTPAPLTLPAPPKVNLRLLVGPRRDDGYHPLRTLMVALDGPVDRVTVSRADARRVTCPGIAGPANLAWAALDALQEEMDDALPPLAVDIEKVLPAQAGLGGGSSDAATTLVAADRLLGLGLGAERLERGWTISLAGPVTFPRNTALREVVPRIPADRLLVETDAPYLLPRTIRPRRKSRRNEPALLPWVVAMLAACRDQSPETVARITTANARALFDLG